MPSKKPNWNKRLISEETRKRKKKGEGFVTSSFNIEEVFDESGEVLDDTLIKFSFGGILIYLSVANAMKLNKLLSDVLNLKK